MMIYKYNHLSVEQLQERILNMNILEDDERLKLFTFFSANLLHFMPNVDVKDHEGAFKELCIQQHLSWKDQYDPHLQERTSITGLEEGVLERLRRKPGIICTYHLGSYRLLNRILAGTGVSFSLVVNGAVLKKEGKSFQKGFNQIKNSTVGGLDIIDAEKPTALFSMIKALKKGQNLLVYVDGNTGAGTTENNVPVSLMAGHLSVRKGVAVLSHLLKCPLYPIACTRASLGEIKFTLHQPIVPLSNGVSRDVFVQNTMQKLYSCLEEGLRIYPFQWECWLYINEHLILPMDKKDIAINAMGDLLNSTVWGVFKVDEHCFVLNKPTFLSYKIPENVYTKLKSKLM